jgi:hypothetical protein
VWRYYQPFGRYRNIQSGYSNQQHQQVEPLRGTGLPTTVKKATRPPRSLLQTVRGCPPPSPRPRGCLDRGTIAATCQRPEKVTLRSAPRTAARRTIVTTAKETRGCLPPSRHLLHLHLLHQTPSYPLTTKVRPVERPPNLPEREKKKTPTGRGPPTSRPPRSGWVGSWRQKGKPRTHVYFTSKHRPSSGRQKSTTPAYQAVPAPWAAPRLTEESSNTDRVEDYSLHAATTYATCQSPEIDAVCQRPAIGAACQNPEIDDVCQRPAIDAACQRPEIGAVCQNTEIGAVFQRPAIGAACLNPEIGAVCQRPAIGAACLKSRNWRCLPKASDWRCLPKVQKLALPAKDQQLTPPAKGQRLALSAKLPAKLPTEGQRLTLPTSPTTLPVKGQ